MSALLCVVPADRHSTRDLPTRQLLRAGVVVSWRDEGTGVLLAASRRETDDADAVSLVRRDHIAVVADASLYYRADLAHQLHAAGALVAPSASPAELIAVAYELWGTDCFERLEGDFAAAVWDGRSRTLHVARDFTGGRPLFHAAPSGGGVAVASSLGALLALPGVSGALDLDALAQSSAWIFPSATQTACRGVQRVAPGGSVSLDAITGRALARRDWVPPMFERAGAAIAFPEAAEQLRALLRDAVRERLSRTSGTAVWMSGGYDSTAVFAAGRDAGANALRPVSVSYPVGDTGREDEAIDIVAARWGADVSWLRSDAVDLFANLESTAMAADEPFVHLYADFNAALARTTASVGANVALGGYGGDQLFWASNTYLADLLVRGKLRTLASEVQRLGLDAAGVLEWVVRPLLPSPALAALRQVGGDRWLQPLEKAVPAWIAADAARDAGLLASFHRAHPRRAGESRSAYDTHFSLVNPFYGRVLETVNAVARQHGVEHRSPLYDRRVVQFAATRPRWERTSGGQQKLLLRGAMRSLLPASVLAPRPYKTGTAKDLFARSARRWLPDLLARMSRAPLLGDLGVIDVDAFRRACEDFTLRGDVLTAGALVPTLQTELWLQGVERRAAQVTAPRDAWRTLEHAPAHGGLAIA